ncbi:MAG: hypothetical protein SZ59_C0004G0018 [candidate division TM6 bacterium GW2011_GWF2_28_16]|nr:MAG: hypothetical protein SZ59_C0004G0018 [candidate division TM6 bacterium GW2011_GWF2_28_16]
MKNFLDDLAPNIIKNSSGQEIGVFFDIKDYNLLLEHLEELYLGKIAQKIKKEEGDNLKSLEDFEKDLD